jgi:protein-S-isoprenylcysteine O-methyltransferase Ste14
MTGRILVLLYGVASYAVFLATYLYAIGFMGNFAVPKSIDAAPEGSLGLAVAINLGLLGLFAVQHSVMARPAFKRWWKRVVPEAMERSTYVLLSSLALIVLFWQWRPLGGVVWEVTDPVGRALIYTVFGAGWLLVLVSTFLINHFDLFGLRQSWLHFRGIPYTPLKFGTPWLYQHLRHPLYVGWFMAFWATPTMTAAHALFALMCTAYILIAVQLEEQDLLVAHGEDYAAYRERVPMFMPRPGRRYVHAETEQEAA